MSDKTDAELVRDCFNQCGFCATITTCCDMGPSSLDRILARLTAANATIERLTDLLRTWGDLMPEFSQQVMYDYGGDYFDVTCKFCGEDQKRNEEIHKPYCVVPTMKAWNEKRVATLATHDAAQKTIEEAPC
jgi:hypothetical protein